MPISAQMVGGRVYVSVDDLAAALDAQGYRELARSLQAKGAQFGQAHAPHAGAIMELIGRARGGVSPSGKEQP